MEKKDQLLLISSEEKFIGSQYDNGSQELFFDRPQQHEYDDLILFLNDGEKDFFPINNGGGNTFLLSNAFTQTQSLRLQVAFESGGSQICHSNIVYFSLRSSLPSGSAKTEELLGVLNDLAHTAFCSADIDGNTLTFSDLGGDTLQQLDVSRNVEVGDVSTQTLLPGESAAADVTSEGSAFNFTFSIPKGDDGPKGDTGSKGDKGDTGPKGDKGDTGPKGDKGDTGPKGDTGSKGDKGDAGPKGDKGDTGPKGDKGDTGPKGDKGDTGPKGDKGEPGEKADITSHNADASSHMDIRGQIATKADKAGLMLYSDLTVYVSVDGNDSTGDGTAAKPYATVKKAISVIPKNLNGYGVTISVAAGTYDVANLAVSGFFGGFLSISGDSGQTVFHIGGTRLDFNRSISLHASGLIFSGTSKTGTIYVIDTVIRFNNCEFKNLENGVNAFQGARLTCSACTFNNNSTAVRCSYGSSATISSCSGSGNGIVYLAFTATINTTAAGPAGTTKIVESDGGKVFAGS